MHCYCCHLQLDPVGPLNELKNFLFSDEGQATIVEWLRSRWYIVASGGLGLIIIMVWQPVNSCHNRSWQALGPEIREIQFLQNFEKP